MKKLLLVILLSNSGLCAFAQDIEPMMAGRPGKSGGPFTTTTLGIQREKGFLFENSNQENGSENIAHMINTYRLGVSSKLELNAGLATQTYHTGLISPENGIASLSAGARYIFLDMNKSFIPKLAVQVGVRNDRFRLDTRKNEYSINAIVLSHNKIFGDFNLITNNGFSYNLTTSQRAYNYTIQFNHAIGKKMGGFIEHYATVSNTSQFYFDSGLTYRVAPNLQLDIYGGAGKNQNRVDFFASAGITWRILSIKNKFEKK